MTGSGASPASRAAAGPAVRSGELFAALSLATDLGTGQAAEHGLRTCLLALELAELAGLDAEQLEDAYYLGLLHSIGCTADAPVTARAFGDDRAHKATYTLIDAGRPSEIVVLPLAQRLSDGADAPTSACVHQCAGRGPRVRAGQSPQPL